MFEQGDYSVLDEKSKPEGESPRQTSLDLDNASPLHCKPDPNAAQSYMDFLHEGEATEFRIMWPKSRLLPENAKSYIALCGCLEDVVDRLVAFNQQGYGIFAVVNQIDERKLTRGGFTKDRDITAVKAVWVDLDAPVLEGELTHIGRLLALPYAPSMIVETSPGRFQAYWLVEEGLSREQGVEINNTLAHELGGDLNATNISRVLRIPGFYNTKQAATQVKIRHAEAQNPSAHPLFKPLKTKKTDTPLDYVQDEGGNSSGALSKVEQQRLTKMRYTHAKERAAYKHTMLVKESRNVNPNLPLKLAQALHDCVTIEAYEDTLLRLWPRYAGDRQTLALAVSGDLYKFRCAESEALNIIEAACRAAGDDEVAERLGAVRRTYRRARGGERITGTGAGTPMTAFEAVAWGPDLRQLPSKERRAEAERRIWEVLKRLPENASGVKKCSSRSLAEMTGVSKNTVSKVLVDLTSRGVLKRESRGVVISLES